MIRLFFCSLFLGISCVSAQNLSGNWAGLLKKTGTTWKQADVIYLSLQKEGEIWEGISRIELINSIDKFAAKVSSVIIKNDKIIIKENYIKNASHSRNTPSCKLDYYLNYTDSTGYLQGKFESANCRGKIGEVVLFRTQQTVNTKNEPSSSHFWVHQFIKNFLRGYPAPEILKIEQEEFKLQPIYFDFDKAIIRTKYFSYLKQMARIVGSMDDVRIKITGNTDAYGADSYNMDLSERRADALRDFFAKHGINANKLDIDFKGEHNPIATNKTSNGRQQNRRVDFSFDYN